LSKQSGITGRGLHRGLREKGQAKLNAARSKSIAKAMMELAEKVEKIVLEVTVLR